MLAQFTLHTQGGKVILMSPESLENLLFQEESEALDFKLGQYEFDKGTDNQRGELLKDIRRRGSYKLLCNRCGERVCHDRTRSRNH